MSAIATKRRLRASQPKATIEDRLLGATERLIEQGFSFATLTVEQLATEAGIARATFYLHFSDKSELVAKLMGRLTQEVVGSAGEWFAQKGQTGPQTVKQALTGIISTFKRHHAILTAVSATAAQDETVHTLHEAMMLQLCEQSRNALSRIVAKPPADGFSWDMMANVLTWSIEQYCARFVGQYDAKQLDDLINTFSYICNSAFFSHAPGLECHA
jgi:AcrR family transcriptional regulator